ncbi:hypothetical protein NHF40_11935 [Maricaulaceae bacterium EIL42A08]|nr:hypothetical protein [Maricaulaceae bacterium EIL42A08]
MNFSVASNRYSTKGTISAAIAAALTVFAVVAQTSAQAADAVASYEGQTAAQQPLTDRLEEL